MESEQKSKNCDQNLSQEMNFRNFFICNKSQMFCKMLQNFYIFLERRRCNSFAFVLKSKFSIANFLQKFTKVLSLNGKEWYSMWQHSNAKLLQKNRQRDKKTQNLYKIKQKVQRFF